MPVPPLAIVPVTVYSTLEVAIGVPEIVPVVLIVNPVGKAGLMVALVNGPFVIVAIGIDNAVPAG